MLRALDSSATSSAAATRDATSACTWKTSVSDASNGCCHRVDAVATWISSGLTCTRLAVRRLFPAHLAGEQIVHAQLAPDLLRALGGPLYCAELAEAVTWRPGSAASLPRISSVIPSAK